MYDDKNVEGKDKPQNLLIFDVIRIYAKFSNIRISYDFLQAEKHEKLKTKK